MRIYLIKAIRPIYLGRAMDDADRAEDYIEVGLEAAIAAARGVKPDPRTRCRECDERLAPHRQGYGVCWACQSRIEAKQSRMGT